MSRQRVRSWDEPSFSIVASARQIPLHPGSPKMIKISRQEGFKFADGYGYRSAQGYRLFPMISFFHTAIYLTVTKWWAMRFL